MKRKYIYGGENKPLRKDYPNEAAYLQALTAWQIQQKTKVTVEEPPLPIVNSFTPSNNFKSAFDLPTGGLQATYKPTEEEKQSQYKIENPSKFEEVKTTTDTTYTVEKGTGNYGLSKEFQTISDLAKLVTGVANTVNEVKNRRNEKKQYIDSLEGDYYDNDPVINNIPIIGAQYGGDFEEMKEGGIPERYKKMGFSRVGQKKKSSRSGKKWMVLASKGGKYKVVHGGAAGMSDYTKHKDEDRKDRFWKRHNAGAPGKSKDPFSPLYWHKRFGTWEEGGDVDDVIIEVEKGEVLENTDNTISKVSDNAPTHEEGGVLVNNVDRVLENTSHLRNDNKSESLLVSKEHFKEMFGFDSKKDLSHSKAMDLAMKYFNSKKNKVESKTNKLMGKLEINPSDLYAQNSLDFNLENMKKVPKEQDVFDILFEHQEMLKQVNNIDNNNNKAQYGGFEFSTIGKMPKGQKTGSKYYGKVDENTFNQLKAAHPNYNWNNFNPKAKQDVLNFQRWFNAQAASQNSNVRLDEDGKLGQQTASARIRYKPNFKTEEDVITPVVENFKETNTNTSIQDSNVYSDSSSFNLNREKKDSSFYEPLRFEDIGSPLLNLINASRIPAKLNPVELNKIKLKLQNPEPTLEQARKDYNTLLNLMPNSGVGMANATNAFSQKYSLDNQVLGQYENINTGIRNQEEQYNANVMDRQSLADAQTRATFEQQQLQGMENLRQQKAKSLDELFNRIAQNRKLNREGNLLMKLFPQFDQFGNFNGNDRDFRGMGYGNVNSTKYTVDVVPGADGNMYQIIKDRTTGKTIGRNQLSNSSSSMNPPTRK